MEHVYLCEHVVQFHYEPPPHVTIMFISHNLYVGKLSCILRVYCSCFFTN